MGMNIIQAAKEANGQIFSRGYDNAPEMKVDHHGSIVYLLTGEIVLMTKAILEATDFKFIKPESEFQVGDEVTSTSRLCNIERECTVKATSNDSVRLSDPNDPMCSCVVSKKLITLISGPKKPVEHVFEGVTSTKINCMSQFLNEMRVRGSKLYTMTLTEASDDTDR